MAAAASVVAIRILGTHILRATLCELKLARTVRGELTTGSEFVTQRAVAAVTALDVVVVDAAVFKHAHAHFSAVP